MNLQPVVRGATDTSLSHKIVAVLMSLILAFGLSPLGQAPAAAYADDGDAPSQSDGASVDVSKVVAAPVVKRSADGKTEAGDATKESGIEAKATADGTNVAVALTATALPKHYNAEGAYAYWAGIGVPFFGEEYTFAAGLGEYQEADAEFGGADSVYAEEGATYSTFYFGSYAPWKSGDKGFVTVKKGTDVAAVYSVDLSGVVCVGDAVAAPLTAEFQPAGYAISQVVSNGMDAVTFASADPLKKHVQGEGGNSEAYWVGVGLPWTDGRSIEIGYGGYSAEAKATTTGTATSDYTPEGSDVSYTTVYLDNAKVTANGGAWVRVMKKGGANAVLAVYTIASIVKDSSAVTIANDEKRGTIEASSGVKDGFATEGETVALTAKPADGYVLSGLAVTDANEKAVAVADDNTFVMPTTAVKVVPTWALVATGNAVAAPLRDHGKDAESDKDADVEPADYAIAQTAKDNVVAVKFTATGLTKHFNADHAEAYWIGAAVPYVEGSLYASGFDAYDDKAEFSADEGTAYELDGKQYRSFYFGTYSTFSDKAAYIAVKNASGDVVVYNLDFADTSCEHAIAAPESITGGKIEVAGKANDGATVEVKSTADENYALESIKATYKSGDETKEIDATSGSFKMPAADVAISAVFKKDIAKTAVELEGNGAVTFDPAKSDAYAPVKSVKSGEVALTASDYDVSYADLMGNPVESIANAGSYQVVVVGKGEWMGKQTLDFTVEPYSLTDNKEKVVIAAEPESATWTGGDIDVFVNVKVETKAAVEASGNTPASPAQYATLGNEDFTYIPGTVSEIGKYAVTVIGKGNYTGCVSKADAVQVVAVDLKEATFAPDPISYTGAALDATGKLTYKDATIDAAGYTLSYSVAEGQTGTLSDGKPLAAGTYTVTATAVEGSDFSGAASAVLTVAPFDFSADSGEGAKVAVSVAEKTYTGEAQENGAVTVTFNGTALAENTDFTVAKASGTNAGKYDVVVTGKGNFAGSKVGEFVIAPASLADVAEVGAIANGVYSGSDHEPELVVKKKDAASKYVLSSDDYDYGWGEGVELKNAGTYTVTVKAKEDGNYTGSIEGSYTIEPRAISDEQVVVSEIEGETYNGETHNPAPSISLNGEALEPTTDFTYSFGDGIEAKDAGDYTVTISGAGNFTGSRTEKFTVKPLAITSDIVKFKSGDLWVDGYSTDNPADQPTVGIQLAGGVAGDGFVTTYKGTNAIVTADSKNFSGMASKSWNLASLSLSEGVMTLSKSETTYDGTDQTPTVTVKTAEAGRLKQGADYTVAFLDKDGVAVSGLINAGDYTVVVAGTGNFGGQLTNTFKIAQQDIADTDKVVIADVSDATYTGSAIEPDPAVTFNGEQLVKGTGYAVAYANNTNAGTATLTVDGHGNFTGSTSVDFKIAKDSSLMTDCKIVAADGNELGTCAYTGDYIKPAIKVVSATEPTVEFAGAFLPVYTSNKNVGTAKVTVVATGNYAGTLSATFNISALDIANAEVKFEDAVYSGKALEPAATVTYKVGEESIELAKDVDYGIEYMNNTNVGTATAILVGAGNYEGVNTASFEVAKKKVAAPEGAAGLKYDGKEQTGVAAGDDYALAGDVAGTDAGDYTATATLKDAVNTEWADGTAGPKTVTWSIAKAARSITLGKNAKSVNYTYGKSFKMEAKVSAGDGDITYTTDNKNVATVDKNGTVKVVKGTGKATIIARVAAAGNYDEALKEITVTAQKAANPLKLQAATASGKNNKAQTYTLSKNAKTKGGILKATGQGTVTYTKVKVTNGKNKAVSKALGNKFTVKAGKLTVAKGTAKGTYKVTVKAVAAGNGNYKSGNQTAVVTVTVKK